MAILYKVKTLSPQSRISANLDVFTWQSLVLAENLLELKSKIMPPSHIQEFRVSFSQSLGFVPSLIDRAFDGLVDVNQHQ